MVIQVENITLRYGRFRALDGATAAFSEGATGLLGPNGAGKTSLLKVLLGFLAPDSGTAKVLGMDVARNPLDVRQAVGYMPEVDCHIPGMNAVQLCTYAGELCGMPRIEAIQRAHEALYYANLGEARYRPLETYSTGMKQRAKLAQALVHGPRLIFLDEPTNGLDPKGRIEMLQLIKDLSRKKGVNVVLSSHILRDVEETCKSVVMLAKGKVARQGSIAELRKAVADLYEVRVKGENEERDRFAAAVKDGGAEFRNMEDGLLEVTLSNGLGSESLFRAAKAADVQIRHLTRRIPSLEEIFARAVGLE
jgi:ABC-2 type transport system ATP-binding protein